MSSWIEADFNLLQNDLRYDELETLQMLLYAIYPAEVQD